MLRSGFAEALSADWDVLDFRPGAGPLVELARALGVPATLTGPTDLKSYALEKLGPGRQLLVFVDQFEEIFDYRRERYSIDGGNDSALFVNLLLAAADQRKAPIRVVLTMRSDYLGECAQFRGLPEALNHGHYLVPRLTRLQQEEAITGPAAALGVEFEPSLVQQLLNDSEDNPDRLPVLQHILKRMWEERSGRPVIRREEYVAIGGWKEALERDGNGVLSGFTEAEQKGGIARLFQWISGTGPAGQPVRRARPFSELPAVTGLAPGRLAEIIAAFIRRDFLQSSTEKISDAKRIDLMHESVIWNWPWLQRLVADEAAHAAQLNFLRESARNTLWLTGLSLEQRPTTPGSRRSYSRMGRTLRFRKRAGDHFLMGAQELQAPASQPNSGYSGSDSGSAPGGGCRVVEASGGGSESAPPREGPSSDANLGGESR